MICPNCKAESEALFQTEHGHRCRPCKRGVWQRANDVICRTPEEFAYWVKNFRDNGREADALILEAQQLTAK